MSTLFISDLHLDPGRPAITALFFDFLQARARSATALYILGDLFEAWIGDDDDAPLATEVATHLRAVRDSGVALYFVHGNRDFLLGPDYAARAGLALLPETRVIDLYGTPTLIMHGDTLCTDDVDYQAFRAKVRNPAWQRQVLALPLVQRRAMAGQLRETSRAANRLKPEDITDVNPAAVNAALHQHGASRLIHGHTHRPGRHPLNIAGRAAERLVLGAWYDQGSLLECTASGCQPHALPLP